MVIFLREKQLHCQIQDTSTRNNMKSRTRKKKSRTRKKKSRTREFSPSQNKISYSQKNLALVEKNLGPGKSRHRKLESRIRKRKSHPCGEKSRLCIGHYFLRSSRLGALRIIFWIIAQSQHGKHHGNANGVSSP